ncbi:MAG: hypothetical protein M5U28_38575 [Sandaracinaceae bacterium]|nr:hypothetical protein [Sandaracinaceae bacterium]
MADVHALRGLMIDDPAERPLGEVERVAPDRPVLAARMLATGALPAARRQVTRVREATMTTPEGRSLARRLARAYEQRVRGLEAWHGYLEDGAIDESQHLESLTTRRQAEVAVMELDQEMERYVPTEPRARGSRDEGDRAGEPGEEETEPEPGEVERPGDPIEARA